MTNYNERLDEILELLWAGIMDNPFVLTPRDEAKQAILRWVADEVVGEKENGSYLESPAWNVVGGRNELRGEQLEILAQHGYKGEQR